MSHSPFLRAELHDPPPRQYTIVLFISIAFHFYFFNIYLHMHDRGNTKNELFE